jgi:hypothetical protein
MTSPAKPRGDRRTAPAVPASPLNPSAAVALALLVPGAAHFALGDRRRAATFFAVLMLMFAAGLGFGGRLFPFQVSEPLVFLAALAEWAMAVPRLVASLVGAGRGDVVAVTYEYGNTFLIAAGLLNTLVMLDAFDRAAGRKGR